MCHSKTSMWIHQAPVMLFYEFLSLTGVALLLGMALLILVQRGPPFSIYKLKCFNNSEDTVQIAILKWKQTAPK